MQEELKTIRFDFTTNQFLLNGRNIGGDVDEFSLEFKAGTWSVCMREKKEYLSSGKAINNNKYLEKGRTGSKDQFESLNVDLENDVLMINGERVTRPTVVTLLGIDGWNSSALFNRAKNIDMHGTSYDKINVTFEGAIT